MAELLDKVAAAGRSGADALVALKADYDGRGRFTQMRVWIVAGFALHVLLTVIGVFLASTAGGFLEAWYQPGFPSNLVVIQNRSEDSLHEVEVVLDGRFRASLPSLAPGPTGLQIDRDFSAAGAAPPRDYRPQRVEVRADGEVHTLELSAQAPP